ncbi:MAG TPA: glucoamylase family protein [Cyclobacteriaceae bacterium]|nr:beta-glucosidase [Cyclobacteriaceae bacterium]HMV09602.1 glucoamylase family protein [Cyclobacteriaceae bacterium]HMV90602.1 glucoamylase family protein [Cyclobacteriaceae bacterium]HMX01066.1 glucoamylase family protein [Cyclobacteriaceae bacterium]HMX51763.1 glucoamylase family protein [Cyclobacteriaceae bacterium]
MRYLFLFVLIVMICASCSKQPKQEMKLAADDTLAISEDSLLTLVQYQTFQYFWDNAEKTSGLGKERTHMDNIYPDHDQTVVTTGGSGFGIMAILVGIERGFITREQALERYTQIVNFLDTADRFHGAWPHWIEGTTGKVKPFGRKDNGGDLVETSFLMQGLLTVREYFKDGNEQEKALAAKINKLWREIDWTWYTHGQNVLYWHWSPEYNWEMNFPVGGYNECLITYVMAASSPTHSIKPEVYHQGWARNDSIKTDRVFYDLPTVLDHFEGNDDPVGPLFWAHYSYLGLDPRHLQDRYADYWKLNQNHALIQYRYCVDNPKGYEGYGPNCWGLTSSYSPVGYAGHSPSEDLGVISPTAALSSFPYTPKESMQFLKFIYAPSRDSLVGTYGPYDAFSFSKEWYLKRYLAIDQGPIPVMIENYRTGMLWKLFMQAPEVQEGLKKLGFEVKK